MGIANKDTMQKIVILCVVALCVMLGAPSAFPQAAPDKPAAAAPAADTAPAAKRPPQAKSKAELDDFNTANAATDLAVVEKSATDFATKYPASELRLLLYKSAMRKAQRVGNSEKNRSLRDEGAGA